MKINLPALLAWLLTAVFVTLKLVGATVVAAWSWWLVFAPLVVLYGLGLIAWVIIAIIAAAVARKAQADLLGRFAAVRR